MFLVVLRSCDGLVGGCLAAARMPRGRAARKACEALGCRRGCPCRADWPAQPLLSSHIRVVSSQVELEAGLRLTGLESLARRRTGRSDASGGREGGREASERASDGGRPFRRVASGGPRPPGRLDASLSCSAPRYKRWSPAPRSSDSDGPLTGPGSRTDPALARSNHKSRVSRGGAMARACVSGQPLLRGPMALSARRRPASVGGTNGARAHGVASR